LGKFRKEDRMSVVFLLIVLAGFIWLCRPLPESERTMPWIWTEIDLWPVLEDEAELTMEELVEYNAKIMDYEPFQFSHPDLETRAFFYDDKKYVFSPEAGLLFETGLGYDCITKLTESRGAFDGLYALGARQIDGSLYYAEAEEKKHLWLPGLLQGEGILVRRFEISYSKYDLQGEGSVPITEEEYMTVRKGTSE